MQKAKKMRKQTLVIAVLAILLVLSLALSVTGAWFTDKDTASASADIQFATVAVDASTMTATVNAAVDQDHILPGDSISLAGSIDPSASTVSIYVAVKIASVSVMGADEATGEKTYDIDLSGATGITVNPVTLEGTRTNLAAEGKEYALYLITAGTAAINYTGSVVFAETLDNEVTIEGTTYVLNDRGDHNTAGATVITGVQIAANLEVVAVQADNLEGETDTEKAAAAATILEGLFTPAA